jgi:hypothetical protein
MCAAALFVVFLDRALFGARQEGGQKAQIDPQKD